MPESYKLTFTPDFDKNNFSGEEVLAIKVLKPTSQIVLNALQIDFREATITRGKDTQTAKVALDEKNETATLTVDEPIQAGPAIIRVRYTGILNNELRGFYLGKDEVKDFFASHPTPSAERTLKQSLESIGYCVDMKAQQSPQMASWLGQQPSRAGL